MSKFRQGKRLIISLLCLMVITLAVFSYFIIVKQGKEKTNDVKVQGLTNYSQLYEDGLVYEIPNEKHAHKKVKEVYDNYEYFSVDGAESLKQFGLAISAQSLTFEFKKVILKNDISANYFLPLGCDEKWEDSINFCVTSGNVCGFAGEFDGCGNSLNLVSPIYEIYKNSVTNYVYLGLFSNITDAKIKNVRVDYRLKIENTVVGVGLYVGGIAALASSSEISNCSVSLNCELVSQEDVSVGAVCVGGAMYQDPITKIDNCYIGNVVLNIVTTQDIHATIISSYCIKNNCVVNNGNVTTDENGVNKFSSWNINALGSVTTNVTLSDAYSNNCYTEKGDGLFSDLNLDYWHIPTGNEFNNGWPYLKIFISSFDEYFFESGDNGDVVIGGDEDLLFITVPRKNVDGTIIEYNISSYVSAQTVFYGCIVEAKADMGYVFDAWVYDELYRTYTATFKQKKFPINFNDITITINNTNYTVTPSRSLHDGVGQAVMTDSISIYYYDANAPYISFTIYSSEHVWTWQAYYDISSNSNKNIWCRYVIKEIKFNDEVVTSILHGETKEFTIQKIDEILQNTTMEEILDSGLEIDITFELKSYNVITG